MNGTSPNLCTALFAFPARGHHGPEEAGGRSVPQGEVRDVYLNGHSSTVRFQDGAESDGSFSAYCPRSKGGRKFIKLLVHGSTIYCLSEVALLELQIRPPKLPGQILISEVPNEMNAEQAALNPRRTKPRLLKRAMMQELHTGRIRLN